MLDIFARILRKESIGSKEVARERLRLVLIHDRSMVSPELINALKSDLIQVIQQYMDIDTDSLLVNVENEDDAVALTANIPIKSLKRVANI